MLIWTKLNPAALVVSVPDRSCRVANVAGLRKMEEGGLTAQWYMRMGRLCCRDRGRENALDLRTACLECLSVEPGDYNLATF